MRQSCRYPTKAALPAAEFLQRSIKVTLVKIGPQLIGENELSVGGLPEQEVRKTLFTAGANEQIDVAALAVKPSLSRGPRYRGGSSHHSKGACIIGCYPRDRVAGGVIDGDAQMETASRGGCAFCLVDFAQDRFRSAGRAGR